MIIYHYNVNMLLVSEIKLGLNEDEKVLKKRLLKKLKIQEKDLLNYQIYKKSIDARKDTVYKIQVLVTVKDEKTYLKYKNVTLYKQTDLKAKHVKSTIRPLVIGYGPSGIFATYRLLEAGLKPIVIEKGKRIKERIKDVEQFFKTGKLNTNSNVQFGEGGAGTFSDAKLTTRIKNPLIEYILDILISFGASKEIKYTNHSHIGTDKIRIIIEKITDYLIANGVTFYFEETLNELILNDTHDVIGIKTDKQTIYAPICLLAIGHSCQKTIKQLNKQGVYLSSKDIAIGFRVEHPQTLIDKNQKGDHIHPCEYFLRYKDKKGVYSFCMCPGGIVIPATSDSKRIVTNGMSYARRDSEVANSAILIQVNKNEYPHSKLGGFDYIKTYEEKAYNISNSYKAPACNLFDYMNNEISPLIFKSTYPLGTTLYNFNNFFKEEDNEIFKKALLYFDTKIQGFIANGIMVGPETRSSSPLRIDRNSDLESINTRGLYPSGEGAGYGGGIMSCALDGLKCADKIINKIDNLKGN